MSNQQAPPEFICPITCDIFNDPVIASDGHTYERTAILEWIRQAGTSPLTRAPLQLSKLKPNSSLRITILSWQNDMKKNEIHQKNKSPDHVIVEWSPLRNIQSVQQSVPVQQPVSVQQEDTVSSTYKRYFYLTSIIITAGIISWICITMIFRR